ncbi:MAG: hypothetical protein M1272_02045 [Firmicutes bacterium]|nr:hypothetical protein [Bacillota bacterium]
MNAKTLKALDRIKDAINAEYGIQDGIPAINHGPCGVFAQVFFLAWNARFREKVHISFVMTPSRDECDHVCIRLPSGELYDGGIGVHADRHYGQQFVMDDMVIYDEGLLDKWSYGLARTYPRFCPHFNRAVVESIVEAVLEQLFHDLSGDPEFTTL